MLTSTLSGARGACSPLNTYWWVSDTAHPPVQLHFWSTRWYCCQDWWKSVFWPLLRMDSYADLSSWCHILHAYCTSIHFLFIYIIYIKSIYVTTCCEKGETCFGPALLFTRQLNSGRSRRGSNVGTVLRCRPFAAPGQRYYPIWFDDKNTGYVFWL